MLYNRLDTALYYTIMDFLQWFMSIAIASQAFITVIKMFLNLEVNNEKGNVR